MRTIISTVSRNLLLNLQETQMLWKVTTDQHQYCKADSENKMKYSKSDPGRIEHNVGPRK